MPYHLATSPYVTQCNLYFSLTAKNCNFANVSLQHEGKEKEQAI